MSVKSSLKEKIPGHSYRMWIDPIVFYKNESGIIVLACPNLFFKKRVGEHYRRLIEEAICAAAGRSVKIRLIVKPRLTGEKQRFRLLRRAVFSGTPSGKPERPLSAFANRFGEKSSLPGGGAPHSTGLSQGASLLYHGRRFYE